MKQLSVRVLKTLSWMFLIYVSISLHNQLSTINSIVQLVQTFKQGDLPNNEK